MKKERFLELMSELPEDLLLDAERPPRRMRMRIPALAACVAILLAAVLVPLFVMNPPTQPDVSLSGSQSVSQNEQSEESPSMEVVLPPTVTVSDTLSGNSLLFVEGSSANVSGGASAPPRFEFPTSGQCVVKAVLKEVLPDLYRPLNVYHGYRPTTYRLLKFETVEVLRGENVPSTFLYRLPSNLTGEFDRYDCFFLSMRQIGLPGYTTVNTESLTIEQLSLPLFRATSGEPELGDVIPFTDGVFDESLWQEKSWLYGYQFARHMLDEQDPYLVVQRGYTEEDTKNAILRQMEEWNPPVEKVLQVSDLEGDTYAAVEELLSGEKGVFSHGVSGFNVVFTRLIDGCQTEETVRINFDTGEITYSEVRYTPSDLQTMPAMAMYVDALAAAYAEQRPNPPRVDATGKYLCSLSVYAWYAKAGDTAYGICKTTWVYFEEGDFDAGKAAYYHFDETYLLVTAEGYRTVTQEELIELFGENTRNLLGYPLGEPYEAPMC